MAQTGAEPIGSMGDDTPIAALSDRPRLVFDYFAQLFAQVTNPPLDAIREELVTSLAAATGPEHNIFDPGPASCRQIVLPYPVISESDLAKIIHINKDRDLPGFAAHVVDGRYRRPAAARPCATGWPRSGPRSPRRSRRARIIVLSDRRLPRPGPAATVGADPVAAADRRRAPPSDQGPDPDQGRPGGRGR